MIIVRVTWKFILTSFKGEKVDEYILWLAAMACCSLTYWLNQLVFNPAAKAS